MHVRILVLTNSTTHCMYIYIRSVSLNEYDATHATQRVHTHYIMMQQHTTQRVCILTSYLVRPCSVLCIYTMHVHIIGTY